MRYMMFIKHTEDYRGKAIPPGLMEAMGEFIGEYAKQGKFIDGAGLQSSYKGKKVRNSATASSTSWTGRSPSRRN